MYGLKQAIRLAHNGLVEHLAKFGYRPSKLCPNIWTHDTRPTKFFLCVDDFGVKYFSEDDKKHLMKALQEKYSITVDTKGENFCGLKLKWNYSEGWVDISMPKFVKNTLNRLNYKPTKKQHAPHTWNVPIYGKNRQFATPNDDNPVLGQQYVKYVQKVVGSFLYYGRAVDNTILPALNDISYMQTKPTKNTIAKTHMLMNYLATYPNAKIRFYSMDMQLHIDSDAAYLVAPKARSRIAGFYYCANKVKNYDTQQPLLNGPGAVE